MQRHASLLNSKAHIDNGITEHINFSSANQTSKNRKITSLCQSAIPIVEKLTYSIGQLVVLCEKETAYSKQSMGPLWDDRYQMITATVHKNVLKAMRLVQQIRTFRLKC
jgi:hypothetical protein